MKKNEHDQAQIKYLTVLHHNTKNKENQWLHVCATKLLGH